MTMYEELKELRQQLTKDEECIINHGKEFTAVYRRLEALEQGQPQIALRPNLPKSFLWVDGNDTFTWQHIDLLVHAARYAHERLKHELVNLGSSDNADAVAKLTLALKHFENVK